MLSGSQSPEDAPDARLRRDSFLIFGSPSLGEEEIAEVEATLRSGWIGTGPRVAEFERAFADYIGAEHAVATNSCTAALHVAMLAAGLSPGDEVITTPMTFAATANAIVHSGAKVVFADCDPLTMNIDPAAVRAAVTPRTRAILPVHFAGRPCDMTELGAIVKQNDLRLIEDCAHSIETLVDGKHAGTFGDAGCFSFYVTKNVVTGEGGMLVTDDAELAARAKILSLHGMDRDAWHRFGDAGYKHYSVVTAGFKYNMMDIQAALGLHQLARVEQSLSRRDQVWEMYDDAFSDLPCVLPPTPEPGSRHARHLYTLLVDVDTLGKQRDAVIDTLTELNIGVGVHYIGLHLHPYYQELLSLDPGQFPNATYISERTLSLPLSPKLTDEDIEDVIHAVRHAFGVAARPLSRD